ncbi:TetR/AcrR family transcriptional regulator [Tabrizicola oligotrophica]|uniref:TetR family transcriptional regulator n=1 Tax=Tabrizicola oligotrophica TaxID=2710650 RepID=A0A6M0QP08_9RHOB|nr:TetR/AcrR family transcriptional regulator [Tabrizicola oligotrophica]NEY88996.1 TetR family transcriptional regulator [Tabrizicola oligotrophica]
MDDAEPKDRRKAGDRRREIAQAALRCLERVGYAELTARKIAAEAQMSLGHISYHFTGMDEVLAEACRLASEQFQVAAEARISLPGATPAERLEAFLKAGFTEDFLSPGPLRTRIDLWSAAIAHPAVAAAERALHDRYRAQVEALLHQVSDPWKTDRIPMVSDLIMATLDGLWLDWMRRRDEQAVRNGLEACVLFARLRLGGT